MFCFNNHECEAIYKSHTVKDSKGRTLCPKLRGNFVSSLILIITNENHISNYLTQFTSVQFVVRTVTKLTQPNIVRPANPWHQKICSVVKCRHATEGTRATIRADNTQSPLSCKVLDFKFIFIRSIELVSKISKFKFPAQSWEFLWYLIFNPLGFCVGVVFQGFSPWLLESFLVFISKFFVNNFQQRWRLVEVFSNFNFVFWDFLSWKFFVIKLWTCVIYYPYLAPLGAGCVFFFYLVSRFYLTDLFWVVNFPISRFEQ